jgi:competence protein ComFB
MESAVSEVLDAAIIKSVCCGCDICRADIAAIALNNLPPKYVAQRDLYAKLDIMRQQFTVDVLTQVAKAAEIVAENPRHYKTNGGVL